MVYQATLNGRRTSEQAPSRPLGDFARHAARLAELQLRLARLDTRDFFLQASLPAVLLLAAAAGLIAVATLAPLGGAYVCSQYFDFNFGLTLLVTACCEAVLACVAGWLGVRKLGRAAQVFARSRSELTANVEQIAAALSALTGRA